SETADRKSPIIYSGHVLKEQLGDRRDSELSQYRLWLAFNTHQVRQAGQKRHSRNGGSGNTQSMVNARAFLATAKAILISINISAPSNN
ncbi:MAG: hypothetical protein WBZ08_26790, partial [Pseudolabrys sp.]